MKKNYTYYLTLLVIPVIAYTFFGYTSGQTNQNSGSPGDGGLMCALCHSGGNFNTSASISTDIPVEGYELNHDYTVTVSVTSTSSKHGFQITAENSGGTKVGIFTAGTGSQTANLDMLVTHTAAGTSLNTWSFTWHSPATDEGNITFYAAVIATNADNTSTGDQIATATDTNVLGVESYQTLNFKVLPNPVDDFLDISYEALSDNFKITISNIEGKLVYNNEFQQGEKVNISNFKKGIYFLTIIDGNKKGMAKFIKK